jgi:hypothetical protein
MQGSNSDGKTSPGQPFAAPKAEIWNGMIDAGNAFRVGRLSVAAPDRSRPRSTDLIKVRNDTGADRERGEVVCFGGFVLTDLEPESIWLKAIATRRGKKFAILKYNVAEDEVVSAQVSGVCLGRVNVTNLAHRAARLPDDGSFVLQSSFSGPVELLWTPEETGEADCVVNIRGESLPIFKATSGIPARSGTTCGSANCVPYYIDDDGELVEMLNDADASQTVQIFSIFSEAVATNAYVTAKDVFGVLAVDSEDCG